MPNDQPVQISITLSPTQVDAVIRAASQGRAPSVSALISESLGAGATHDNGSDQSTGQLLAGGYLPTNTEDPRLSRSLLRGLSLLTAFGPDGGERGIVELADDLGMSPSTAHRYALTLVELGLLERCPRTRKYRLAGC